MSNKFREAFRESFSRCCFMHMKRQHPKCTYSVLSRSALRGPDSCTDSSGREDASNQSNTTFTFETSQESGNIRKNNLKTSIRKPKDSDKPVNYTTSIEPSTFNKKNTTIPKKRKVWSIFCKYRSNSKRQPITFKDLMRRSDLDKVDEGRCHSSSSCDISNSSLKDVDHVLLEYELTGYLAMTKKKILRKKYDNIKKRTTKKFAEEKCNVHGTGGGPPIDIKFDPIDTEIKEFLGVRLEGNATEFGGDANVTDMISIVHNNQHIGDQINDIDMNEELIITNNDEDLHKILEPSTSATGVLEVYDHDYYQSTIDLPIDDGNQDGNKENMQTGDWSKYTLDMLRSTKSKALISGIKKRKNHLTTGEIYNKVSQWAEAKSKLENSKVMFTEKEQLLKLKLLQEKHDLEISILPKAADAEERRGEEEHQLKLKKQQEKHDIQMQILQLEHTKLLKNVKK
ncbi:hypothetical protein RN001_004791 [Aquatica leii]|uniref:Uncharacterized protein n=1 Tax=Aquatica leii TaxID=1421715 RepID=A0AAN7PB59_9COLE|nr:hypothetical protein RN001_004791 [Aquatica leii]